MGFVSLCTAFSGLQASQAGIDIASHNVSNAAAPGYTRQRVERASCLPHYAPFGPVGTGVDIQDITRARSAFLDERVWATAGDQNAMSTAVGEIDIALDTVLQGLTRLGAVGRQIENAQGRHLDEVNTVRSQLSQIEDVDLAEAVLELQMQQTAYETALAAFGRASRPSLVDFLR